MIDERLSAYIDGELGRRESLSELERLVADPGLRETWARLHLIRDCLRGDTDGPAVDDGFAGRITTALAAEGSPTVTPFSPRGRGRRPAMIAGLAMAASLAVVAILVGIDWQVGNLPGDTPAIVSADPIESAVPSQPVAVARDETGSQMPVRKSRPAHPLDEYLIEHQALSVDYGMAGATPSYTRVTAAAGQSRR